MIAVKPIDGWGFSETVDGTLAHAFHVDVIESEADFGHGIRGWKAKVLDGKYAGGWAEMIPRNNPWSQVVVLQVYPDAGNRVWLYSGMAETKDLACPWL